VAGELIITDPFIDGILHPTTLVNYTVQALFAVGVIVVGKLWQRYKLGKECKENPGPKSAGEGA
jgi:hypothetical protein